METADILDKIKPAVMGWIMGTAVSGTYTPTLTNTTNITSSTARVCQYMRVGSVATVSGAVNVTPTGAGATVLRVSLPVASALANAYELAGMGATTVLIRGDAGSDTAEFVFAAPSGAAIEIYFHFTYRIV